VIIDAGIKENPRVKKNAALRALPFARLFLTFSVKGNGWTLISILLVFLLVSYLNRAVFILLIKYGAMSFVLVYTVAVYSRWFDWSLLI